MSGSLQQTKSKSPFSLTACLPVGVYGYYKNTAFTIVAGPVGGISQLTEGTPALFSAFPAYECSVRSEVTGECIDPHSSTLALAGYFSFKTVGSLAQSGKSVDDQLLVFTVEPQCNTSSSSSSSFSSSSSSYLDPKRSKSDCYPGCACNPFTAFVTSCVTGKCSPFDR